jgi:glycosyltransferase involved in cell wall biosynthesis
MLVNLVVGEKIGEIYAQTRIQQMIHAQLKNKVDFNMISYHGLKYSLLSLITKHLLYPHIVRKKMKEGIVHVISQDQAHVLSYVDPKRSVVTALDIFPLYVLRRVRQEYGKLNYLLHIIDVPLWLKGLKRAGKIIAISKFTKKELVKGLGYPTEKIEVVYLGVDRRKYRPLHSFKKPTCFEDGKTILYVGTEEFRKNVPTLVKALHKLKKKIPTMKMVKVGRARSRLGRKKLLNLISELNLKKDVKFIEYVSEKDMPLFYNSADLFVFPSIYEGFGLPPLEAMACGLPVVTSNTSSLPEVVGDAGIMKDPNDVEGLANAMYEVLTDNGLREDLIKKGLKRAKIFSWEKTAKKISRIYKEISLEAER